MSTYQWNINTSGQGAGDTSRQWTSASDTQAVHSSWQQPRQSASQNVQIGLSSWSRPSQAPVTWQSPQPAREVQPEISSWDCDQTCQTTTSVTISNVPWQQPLVQGVNTSPSPMAYPIYQSSPSAPGPQDGTLYPSRGNGWGGGGTSGGGGGIPAHGASQQVQVVHQTPTGATTYYCKELNGSWSLRTTTDIMNNCQPGDWRWHSQTGFPYWVRKTAA